MSNAFETSVEGVGQSIRRAKASTTPPIFEVELRPDEARRRGAGPKVRVRCGGCRRRLFDVAVGVEFDADDYLVPDGSLRVERKCPDCDLINGGAVTMEDGRPLDRRDALAGAWRCRCGRSLGFVLENRGRVHVTCRCRREARVVAADAIAPANRQAA